MNLARNRYIFGCIYLFHAISPSNRSREEADEKGAPHNNCSLMCCVWKCVSWVTRALGYVNKTSIEKWEAESLVLSLARPGPEEIPGVWVPAVSEEALTKSPGPGSQPSVQSYGQIGFLVSSGSVHCHQHRQSDTSEHWIRPQKCTLSSEMRQAFFLVNDWSDILNMKTLTK